MTTPNKISLLIDNQIPDFIKSDHPAFVNFVKAYYQWLDDVNTGKVLYQTRKLLDYSDIDATTDEFIQHFRNEFLPYFPEDILADKPKLIKQIREFYQKKGSEESLKFLFRVLYKQDIDVLYPKENILKASDGKWKLPLAVRLTTSNTSSSFDVSTLDKRLAFGSVSRASCIIESAYRTIDSGTNADIFELYISNLNRTFNNGENLEISAPDANENMVVIFSEQIIGSISNLKIDPRNRGLRYRTGDPVVFVNGLGNTATASKAVAYVNNVTTGQIQSIVVNDGGYGFRQWTNSIITITSQIGDNGSGANAIISEIDAGNSVAFRVVTDSIYAYANVHLNTASYLFPNMSSANIDTALSRALSTEVLTIAPIKSVFLENGGGGYSQVPTITPTSAFNTDLSYLYYPNIASSPTNFSNWANTRQYILDLGTIANIEILNGGGGYNNTTDTIYISGIGNGRGATFDFTTDIDGVIISANVINGGEGYRTTDVAIDSDISGGGGAILVAYRYGEGANLTPTVDDIGRIKDFRFTSRGSGYIDTPRVSLRISDLILSNVGDQFGMIKSGDFVYQGANLNTYTYYATVESYNTSNSQIRLYDYSGAINTSANLKFATFNAGISNAVSYGNGLAKANAEFLNGLIRYDGFYLNTDGFLSADKRLQDAVKYHNYSYVVIAEKALEEYRQALLDIIHPSGMKLLGYNQLLNIVEYEDGVTSDLDKIISNGNVGTITTDSFSPTGIVQGFSGTAFTSAKANDLLVISSNNSSVQVKIISSIASANQLVLESNTRIVGSGSLIASDGDTTIYVVNSIGQTMVSATDIISYNIGGTIYFNSIIGVTGNILTLDGDTPTTVTLNNVYPWFIYPTFNNVSYQIVSTGG